MSGERALAPADRARLLRAERASAAVGAVLHLLEHPQQLAHPADQQAFLLDLHPCARRRWKDDVVTWTDRHPHPDVIPPVEAGADRKHDPVLRRWLVRARGYEQAGAPDTIRIELLDDDSVEKWS